MKIHNEDRRSRSLLQRVRCTCFVPLELQNHLAIDWQSCDVRSSKLQLIAILVRDASSAAACLHGQGISQIFDVARVREPVRHPRTGIVSVPCNPFFSCVLLSNAALPVLLPLLSLPDLPILDFAKPLLRQTKVSEPRSPEAFIQRCLETAADISGLSPG